MGRRVETLKLSTADVRGQDEKVETWMLYGYGGNV